MMKIYFIVYLIILIWFYKSRRAGPEREEGREGRGTRRGKKKGRGGAPAGAG